MSQLNDREISDLNKLLDVWERSAKTNPQIRDPADPSVTLSRHNPVQFRAGPSGTYTVIQHRVIEAQVSLRALEDSFFRPEHRHD